MAAVPRVRLGPCTEDQHRSVVGLNDPQVLPDSAEAGHSHSVPALMHRGKPCDRVANLSRLKLQRLHRRAFELQNRSAIERPISFCANGRNEADDCKACNKWRTALEAAGVVSIDADVNCRIGCDCKRDRLEQVGGTGVVTTSSKASGTAEPHRNSEREFALQQSRRGDSVFDTLIEVLEATPEALSEEYSEDLLCDLVRSYAPDITTEEIAAALDTLSSRAIALGEFIQNKRRAERESG